MILVNASQAGYRASLTASIFTGAPFHPEQTDLGDFVFASWVRNGLATAIDGPPSGLRAAVPVSFDVVTTPADATPPLPTEDPRTVSRTLTLRGPGDVIGIDQAQIIRRNPAPNVFLADDSTLALIEFDRPDLPWLHSPFPADGGRLMPWIALIVCDASVSSLSAGTGGLPDRLATHLSELQPLGDAWAWAHAQVPGKADAAPPVADRLGDGYADANLSRLLCPRKLSINTDYIACVVPTFDCGVKAGLGLGGGTLDPAWGAGAPGTEIILPVYTSWRFTISDSFTFEKLARRLVPVQAPWQIGRRAIDLRTPHGGVADDLDPDGGVQLLKCALYSPAPVPADAPKDKEWSAARTAQLRARVEVTLDDRVLPRVGPRFYARFQRGSTTIPTGADPIGPGSDWFTALNLRPVDRIVAGLGTRVVQNDQDKLMQAAWLQVGEIAKANAALDRIRLARYVAEALVARTLARLPLAALTATTYQVHGKIAMPGTDRTVWSEITASALPRAAAGMALRRALVAGPVVRAALQGATLASRSTVAALIGSGTSKLRDMRVAYRDPAGLGALTPGIVAQIPADRLARALGVRPQVAAQTALRKFGRVPSLADAAATPRATWNIVDNRRANAVTAIQADRLAMLDAAMTNVATLSPGRAEALGAQYALLAAKAPAVATRAAAQVTALDTLLGNAPRAVPLSAALRRRVRTVFTPAATRAATRTLSARTRAAAAVSALSERFNRFGQLHDGAAAPVERAMTNAVLADSLAGIASGIAVRPMPKTPVSAAPAIARATLLTALEPGPAARRSVLARLGSVPHWLPADWFDDLQLKPIMAAPRFDRPMWAALQDWDKDWLIPNLGMVHETDFITLLLDNPRFSETYLVGLSDEMGRELLWRGYPTDQRGTYFWRMWSEHSDDLAQQIARFSPGPLDSHLVGGGKPRVVMMVKGAVVKRHPEALFVAAQRSGDAFAAPPAPGEKGGILFHAALNTDTILVGFDLFEDDIRGGNWWFLLAEHPAAPQFGLDSPDGAAPAVLAASATMALDKLTWGHLPMVGACLNAGGVGANVTDPDNATFKWATDAAAVARILLQNPARAAFEGKALIQGMN